MTICSCNIADEMHYKRHRAISIQIKEIKENDESLGKRFTCERKQKPPSIKTPNNARDSDAVSKHGSQTSIENITKQGREIEKGRKSAACLATKKPSKQIVTQADIDLISEVLHSEKINSKSSALGIGDESEIREPLGIEQTARKKHLKYRRAECKAIDVDFHETGQTIETESDISLRDIRSRCMSINTTASVSQGVSDIDPKIFERLGVQITNQRGNRKGRKEMIARLARAIRQDFEIVEKDESESKFRRASFWRYVSKGAATSLNERHMNFSWATGELRKETWSCIRSLQLEDENACDLKSNDSPFEKKPAVVTGDRNNDAHAKPHSGDPVSCSDDEPRTEDQVEVEISVDARLEAAICAVSAGFPKGPDDNGGMTDRSTNFKVSKEPKLYREVKLPKKASRNKPAEKNSSDPTTVGTEMPVKKEKLLRLVRPCVSGKQSQIPVPAPKTARILRIVNIRDNSPDADEKQAPANVRPWIVQNRTQPGPSRPRTAQKVEEALRTSRSQASQPTGPSGRALPEKNCGYFGALAMLNEDDEGEDGSEKEN